MKGSAGALESFLEALKNQDDCDVIFAVGPQQERIPCHKMILVARSNVFTVMFKERWINTGALDLGQDNSTATVRLTTKEPVIIILPDVNPQSFREFLKFLYADVISVKTAPEIEQLLYLAEKYDVSILKVKCEKILSSILTLQNAIQMHFLAGKYFLVKLFNTAGKLILTEFSKLVSEPSFLTMKIMILESFVETDYLVIDEMALFNALVTWAESQCKTGDMELSGGNLRTVLGGILPNIRFPLMTVQEFRKHVVPKGILTDQEKLEIFEFIGLDEEDRSNFDVSTLKFPVNRRKGSTSRSSEKPSEGVKRRRGPYRRCH